VSEERELWDTLRRANRVCDEVPKATAPKPIEACGGLAPHAVVGARVRPDLQAASKIPRCLSGVIPVEKELPALSAAFNKLEVLASVALICAELPAEVLPQVPAEVNRSVEVEDQVPGLWREDARAELAKRGDLAVMNQAVHEAIRRARRWCSRCHGLNLGRDGQRVCKT